jgi:NCAIR mutase (PurE)-related protein
VNVDAGFVAGAFAAKIATRMAHLPYKNTEATI